MSNRFWAVIIKDQRYLPKKYRGFCYTWDIKHPEDDRVEETVRVWAVYPRKKDALSDAKFRGGSEVKEVFIKLK